MMGFEDFRVSVAPASATLRAEHYRERLSALKAVIDLSEAEGREPSIVQSAMLRMLRANLVFAEAQLANPPASPQDTQERVGGEDAPAR